MKEEPPGTARIAESIGDVLTNELDRRAEKLAQLRELVEHFPEPALLESIFAQAVDTFADPGRAARWMLSSIQALAGKTPIDALTCGEDWVQAVQQSLSAIRYGGVA